MTSWIDTHCHLQLIDEADADVAADARAAGVGHLVCVGIDVASSRQAVSAAAEVAHVSATIGLHPHVASSLDDQWDDLLALAGSPGVVAVGECGFDLHRNLSSLEDQEAAFCRQISLAKERDLTLVIHTRDAWDETFAVLDAEGVPDRVVFHCFSGGPIEARRCADTYGAWLSVAGPIGYPNNEKLRDALRCVPSDQLVVETDAPFLSPQGFRGQPNVPARVAVVGEQLALVLGRPSAEVAELTSQNAALLFRLPQSDAQ